MNQPTEQSFLNDVSLHTMTVIRDHGVHRHLRFGRPGSSNMYFDIVTYPHFLVYSGDMGCYVFSRINDMFEFFRNKTEGPMRISERYWAEKLEATDRPDGHKCYCPDIFRERIIEELELMEADQDLRKQAEEYVLAYADEGEFQARQALDEFEHNGRRIFSDTWEWNFDQYTFRFVWCCYAIVWGIRQYDTARAAASATGEP